MRGKHPLHEKRIHGNDACMTSYDVASPQAVRPKEETLVSNVDNNESSRFMECHPCAVPMQEAKDQGKSGRGRIGWECVGTLCSLFGFSVSLRLL